MSFLHIFPHILDGFLLSDGYIGIQKRYKNARFSQKSKYYEYAVWIIDAFEKYGISFPPSSPCNAGKSSYGAYQVISNTHTYLTEQRLRWYISGKKIVPEDIVLHQETVKHWFIGDGNLSYCRKRFERIKLSTNGFSDNDRQLLCHRLLEIGFSTTISRLGEIYIKRSLTPLFLHYIGMCPVQCYAYKWEYTNWDKYSYLKSGIQETISSEAPTE